MATSASSSSSSPSLLYRIYSVLSFSWVSPLLAKGDRIAEGDGLPYLLPQHQSQPLTSAFEREYAKHRASIADRNRNRNRRGGRGNSSKHSSSNYSSNNSSNNYSSSNSSSCNGEALWRTLLQFLPSLAHQVGSPFLPFPPTSAMLLLYD